MKMNWDALTAIAELIAACAVVASIVFLAMQIRKESDATLANTTQGRQSGIRDTMLEIAGSDHIAPILAKTEWLSAGPAMVMFVETYGLNEEEAIRLNAVFVTMMRQSESNFRMPQSSDEREQALKYIAGGLDSMDAFGKWWDLSKASYVDEFVNAVDSHRG